MNNLTNLTTTLSLAQKALQDLDTQVYVNVGIFVVCLSTVLSNLGVMFILYKGRNVKFSTHHYSLIIHLSAVACFQALYLFVYMGIIRLFDTVFRIPANMSIKNCGLILLVFEVSQIVDAYNVFVLAIDRLAAVVIPFRYNIMKITKEYKILTYGFPWFFGIIDASAKFFLWTDDFTKQNLSVCLQSNTRTADYQNYKYYRSLIVGTVTMFVYMGGFLFVKYKICTDRNNATQLKKELGFKLMVMCCTDAVIYTSTLYLSQVYGSIVLINASPQARVILSPIALILVVLGTTPRFFVLYFLSEEFRKILRKSFQRDNKVFVAVAWYKSFAAVPESLPTQPIRAQFS